MLLKKQQESHQQSIESVPTAKVDCCEICDFKTDKKNGLLMHMRKKHATIEQLDGNNTFGDQSNDDSNEESD